GCRSVPLISRKRPGWIAPKSPPIPDGSGKMKLPTHTICCGRMTGGGRNLHTTHVEQTISVQMQGPRRYNFAATRSVPSRFVDERWTRNLVHWPQIPVQPVQCFLDQFVAWDVVTGFVEQVFLLVFPRTQQPIERLVSGFHGEKEIVVSIQHQDRLLNS